MSTKHVVCATKKSELIFYKLKEKKLKLLERIPDCTSIVGGLITCMRMSPGNTCTWDYFIHIS